MLRQLILSTRLWPLLFETTSRCLMDNAYKQTFILLALYLIPAMQANSSIYNTLASGLLILPYVLFSSIAGDLCDKHSKSSLIIIFKTLEVFLVAFGCWAIYNQHPIGMMTTIFFLGARSTFLTPLRLAITPEYLKEKELLLGNTLFEISLFSSIVLGDILANIIFLEKYKGMTILLSTLMTLSIASWIAALFLPTTKPKNPHHKINYNIITSSWNIIRQTKHYRTLYLCILGISWFWLVAFMVMLEIPLLLKEIINASPEVITFILIIFA